jgi:hypothetical protein
VGRRLNGSMEEADGRGAAGEAGKAGGGAAVGRGEAALEVGDGPDGWAPSVRERRREECWAAGAELGRAVMGRRTGPRREKNKDRKKKEGRWVGPERGRG